MPAVPLGMLGMDKRFQGKELGSALLANAVRRSLGIADAIGTEALVAYPANDSVRALYARHGFAPIPCADRTYLPLKL